MPRLKKKVVITLLVSFAMFVTDYDLMIIPLNISLDFGVRLGNVSSSNLMYFYLSTTTWMVRRAINQFYQLPIRRYIDRVAFKITDPPLHFRTASTLFLIISSDRCY